jgi:hypothetical protein
MTVVLNFVIVVSKIININPFLNSKIHKNEFFI